MKKTDMELQAIRDKLRLLESEPPVGDVLSVPWSSPQQSSFGSSSFSSAAAQPVRQTSSQRAGAGKEATPQRAGVSPQAAAIETLKQRSGAQTAQARRADELISQEIYRLEVHAQNINERSQQQANEILALKRSAQQAALALRRQGIHNHPQLDTIAKFLEPYPSAAVPHLARDSQGHFALSHTTINLHHAEQEAQSTAETLRNRRSPAPPSYTARNPEKGTDTAIKSHLEPFVKVPFSQPIAAGPSVDDYSADNYEVDSNPSKSHRQSRLSRKGKRWTLNPSHFFRRKQRSTPTYSSPANSRFSLLDGAIWFSGAAIARIIIEAVVLSYPPLRMPLLLILFTIISFAIYRVVVSKSSDLTAAYRLGITLLGLFLGGSF